MKRKNYTLGPLIGKILSRSYIIITLIVILIPLLWMFSMSFRKPDELTQSRFLFIPKSIDLSNYGTAAQWATSKGFPFTLLYKNSAIVTFSSILLTLIIATLAGYAFAKFQFKLKNGAFFGIMLGLMLPIQVILIPIFVFSKYTHLLNTYFSLILPYTAFGLPISIFIMRQFFYGISNELMEAARIDGATEFGIFLKIALPISRPALATVIIVLFLQNWNEFILARILLIKEKLYTFPVALSTLVSGEGRSQPWGSYAAVVFISLIPIIIIFLIFQNWFIKGLTAGSVKG